MARLDKSRAVISTRAMSESLYKTPLWEAHRKLGARMMPFGGWDMPVQYEGILAEHHQTRTAVTVFDTCHMGRFLVSGGGTLAALSRIVSADLRSMRDGQCRYGFLLREDGGIMDDLITYRFNDTRWMLVVNCATRVTDADWVRKHLPSDVQFEDASDRTGKLDVQGPLSLDAASSALGMDVTTLKYFRFVANTSQGGEIVVSRTGYTGEKGVEIFADTNRIIALWDALLAGGVKPAGLGARDTLRLEAGLPLYGHELSLAVTPVEAAMERYAVKTEDFIGRAAVQARLASGPRQRLAGFRVAGRQSPRNGNRVLAEGVAVGEVTSGSFSPNLQYAIGFAYIRTDLAESGRRIEVDTGRNRLAAEVANIPFYRGGAQ